MPIPGYRSHDDLRRPVFDFRERACVISVARSGDCYPIFEARLALDGHFVRVQRDGDDIENSHLVAFVPQVARSWGRGLLLNRCATKRKANNHDRFT